LATYGYQSEGWKITLTLLPANLIEIDGNTPTEDSFDISLSYITPPPYIRWIGRYSAKQGITEANYAYRFDPQSKISPDQVRTIALNAVQALQPDIVELVVSDWELIGTQEGLGESVASYTSAGWTVTVTWSEYSGNFVVYGLYESISDPYVEIEWDATVAANGEDFVVNHFMYFGGE